ncbi:hypothetical protein RRG08_030625 [Elysia crispata]|uniref:Uncharacterized protein n=1 Tax=Elysia crispata TaxID=231223 RepID=A0AAE0Y3L2_9GAST|nr:hypothetical protein RRG08_030625 [Elysia crispata]
MNAYSVLVLALYVIVSATTRVEVSGDLPTIKQGIASRPNWHILTSFRGTRKGSDNEPQCFMSSGGFR